MEVSFDIFRTECDSVVIDPCGYLKETMEVNKPVKGAIEIKYKGKRKQERFTISTIRKGCLILNLHFEMKSKQSCAQYKMFFFTRSNFTLNSFGFITIDYYFHPHYAENELFFVQDQSTKNYFESKNHHLVKQSKKRTILELDISSYKVDILGLFFSIVFQSDHFVKNANQKLLSRDEFPLPVPLFDDVSDFLSDSSQSCYKLSLKGKMGKIKVIGQSFYSRVVFVRPFEKVPESKYFYTQENGICSLNVLSGTPPPCDEHMKVPSRASQYSVIKSISSNHDQVSLYFDGSHIIRGAEDYFQVLPHLSAYGKDTIQNVQGIFHVNIGQASSDITVVKEHSGVCYNQKVETNILEEYFHNDVILLYGSVQYSNKKYFMYFKSRDFIINHHMNNLQCYDAFTCGNLDAKEPDLVSWESADKYCRQKNMTLVTIGSKEEEIRVMSLQTSIGKDGR